MDRNEAVSDFIKTYPALYSWLYFNTVNMQSGDVAMITDEDREVNMFIDGTQEREYIFNIAFVQMYDNSTSDTNMQAMEETQNFNAWIKEQNFARNYPDFGKDTVNSINVLSEIPLMGIDENSNTASYMLQLSISYLRKEKG